MSTSPDAGQRTKVVIMGAAGRDFHDFATVYRDDPRYEVVAFTATQIPGIDDRVYPPDLAGPLYPAGIPIRPEPELAEIIAHEGVDEVAFAYSDIAYADLMHKASTVQAAGADFVLHGPDATMLASRLPVIATVAARTGVGKSGITRRIAEHLEARGLRTAAIRHPMPYRDLSKMAVERYETLQDLDDTGVTIEEREEYEHLVRAGIIVYAGVDYSAILAAAEAECDVILWDGGNNDMSFIRPDLQFTALDPHRAGHERAYYPGETNFLMADVIVINKVDTAPAGAVDDLVATVADYNPNAQIVLTNSAVHWPDEADDLVRGKRALVIEDGPTVTHGGMGFGAGALAAGALGAAELIDPRPYAVGSLRDTFAKYPHLTEVLPAMGYSDQQLADLTATIEASPAEVVIVGTPIDLTHIIEIHQPSVRVTYGVEDASKPGLDEIVDKFLASMGLES
jgi:predicted GTPase